MLAFFSENLFVKFQRYFSGSVSCVVLANNWMLLKKVQNIPFVPNASILYPLKTSEAGSKESFNRYITLGVGGFCHEALSKLHIRTY